VFEFEYVVGASGDANVSCTRLTGYCYVSILKNIILPSKTFVIEQNEMDHTHKHTHVHTRFHVQICAKTQTIGGKLLSLRSPISVDSIPPTHTLTNTHTHTQVHQNFYTHTHKLTNTYNYTASAFVARSLSVASKAVFLFSSRLGACW